MCIRDSITTGDVCKPTPLSLLTPDSGTEEIASRVQLEGAPVNLDGGRETRALVQAGQAGAAGLHPAVTRLEYREQAESQESERHGCEEKPPERLRQDRLEGAVQSRRLLPLEGQGCIAEPGSTTEVFACGRAEF